MEKPTAAPQSCDCCTFQLVVLLTDSQNSQVSKLYFTLRYKLFRVQKEILKYLELRDFLAQEEFCMKKGILGTNKFGRFHLNLFSCQLCVCTLKILRSLEINLLDFTLAFPKLI